MAHGMFRSDNLEGTHDGKYLVSLEVTGEAIDNGRVVKYGALKSGEREVRTYTTPAANDGLGAIAIIGSEEVNPKKKFDTLDQFTNAVGTIARGYIPVKQDAFAITEDAFDKADGVTVTAGSTIFELQASTKLKAVASATSGSTVVGVCEAIENDGDTVWYVIRVA